MMQQSVSQAEPPSAPAGPLSVDVAAEGKALQMKTAVSGAPLLNFVNSEVSRKENQKFDRQSNVSVDLRS